jgi:hypothetical protein
MTPERPIEASPTDGISRRKVLKRIGGGVAIAWTAPVLTSLRTPAFAATPTCPASGPCDVYVCNSLNPICGTSGNLPPIDNCICSKSEISGCFCWGDDFCLNRPDCRADGSCDGGLVCVSNCCDVLGSKKCWAPCANPKLGRVRHVSSGQTGSGA